MMSRLAGSMTLLAALLGTAHAAPARLPYEPPPHAPAVYDFRGTWWFGKTYEGNDWTIVFHPDGSVTNTDGGSTYPKSGTWRSTGNSLHMDLNQKYYEFRGIVIGDRLEGDSSNVKGLRWKTTFVRIAPK
jgi:hypothetical protein